MDAARHPAAAGSPCDWAAPSLFAASRARAPCPRPVPGGDGQVPEPGQGRPGLRARGEASPEADPPATSGAASGASKGKHAPGWLTRTRGGARIGSASGSTCDANRVQENAALAEAAKQKLNVGKEAVEDWERSGDDAEAHGEAGAGDRDAEPGLAKDESSSKPAAPAAPGEDACWAADGTLEHGMGQAFGLATALSSSCLQRSPRSQRRRTASAWPACKRSWTS